MLRYILPLFLVDFASSYELNDRFVSWSRHHNVSFDNNEHYMNTFNAWYDNDNYITSYNSIDNGSLLAHNQFSGMNSDEFRGFLGTYKRVRNSFFGTYKKVQDVFLRGDVDAYVSWVDNGGVTPVKNQGQCGSCWSFSTTGALEGAYFVKYHSLITFSEQQLVDCDERRNDGSDNGCNGGLMDNAFSWIGKNNGLCSENEYPYVSGTTKARGDCSKSCTNIKGSGVSKFVDVPPSSDQQMMLALMKNPVAVAIQADEKAFQLYSSGILKGSCGTGLDHGVLAVGYGSDTDGDFYIVKNSWGETWGENGYIRLGRGDDYNDGDGQCGILLQASYPVL
jgi:C1A family cysteine protease